MGLSLRPFMHYFASHNVPSGTRVLIELTWKLSFNFNVMCCLNTMILSPLMLKSYFLKLSLDREM